MQTLQFQVPLEEVPGFRADAVVGDAVFHVLIEPRDVRRLRASLIELAYVAAAARGRKAVLLLDAPRISASRIASEWARAGSVLNAAVMERLTLAVHRAESPPKIFGALSAGEREALGPIVREVRSRARPASRGQPEAFFEILRILLIHWFRGTGPLTSKALCKQAGFSYPTVAAATERLGPHLARHPDRRLELAAFPRGEWMKLVSQAEEVRSTRRYADRSGRPRAPEKLAERLRELRRPDIAVGGVSGARHYLPGLDLLGTPRLDLVVHAGRSAASDDFVRRLDPALKTAEPGEPARLAVHFLHRATPFFEESGDGSVWADQVECLLDLHEARLDAQALEFLERLGPKPRR